MERWNLERNTSWPSSDITSYVAMFWMKAFSNMRSAVQYAGTTPLDSTRQFIKLEQSFKQQLEQNHQFFEGQNDYVSLEKMKLSADALLNCQPDKISLQVTDEGSIYYTILKNDITIYFQHYLIDEFDGNDEAIATVYKGDKILFNHGGSLAETIAQLGLALSEFAIDLPVFA